MCSSRNSPPRPAPKRTLSSSLPHPPPNQPVQTQLHPPTVPTIYTSYPPCQIKTTRRFHCGRSLPVVTTSTQGHFCPSPEDANLHSIRVRVSLTDPTVLMSLNSMDVDPTRTINLDRMISGPHRPFPLLFRPDSPWAHTRSQYRPRTDSMSSKQKIKNKNQFLPNNQIINLFTTRP